MFLRVGSPKAAPGMEVPSDNINRKCVGRVESQKGCGRDDIGVESGSLARIAGRQPDLRNGGNGRQSPAQVLVNDKTTPDIDVPDSDRSVLIGNREVMDGNPHPGSAGVVEGIPGTKSVGE